MKDKNDLLPCPFCKGKASIMQNYLNYYFVICEKCFARTDVKRLKEKAVELWNQRAESED